MRNKSPLDDFDGSALESSKDDNRHAMMLLEAAHAASIEGVHKIAGNLERKLNQNGF
jgi:hypothetical protein